MENRNVTGNASALAFDPALADGAFHVIDRGGTRFVLPGIEGFRLMEIMRESGLDIPALCGGSCSCGTCHITVAPEWMDRLPAARDDEEEKLDALLYAGPLSRLACQIIWNAQAMDGLQVTLAPLEE